MSTTKIVQDTMVFQYQLLVPGGIQCNPSLLFSHEDSIQTEWTCQTPLKIEMHVSECTEALPGCTAFKADLLNVRHCIKPLYWR